MRLYLGVLQLVTYYSVAMHVCTTFVLVLTQRLSQASATSSTVQCCSRCTSLSLTFQAITHSVYLQCVESSDKENGWRRVNQT